ncbi:MAG: hypothetical protein IKK26_00790, partial [Clostridia bacterium]|nr:hypothetical protein [Clostridia bacterium]
DEIAKPLNDYSSAGKTMTFNAKGGDAMYNKTASGGNDYRSHWFPHTSSHSILMDEDADKNTFLFKYYYKEKVNYKVMYINRINGAILGESGVKSTPNAIVTERFRPFSGYIPEEYYIQHSVAYDPIEYEGDNLYHVSDENIIYFYYVPDTEHALYRIEHYHQNADDDDYTLFTAEQGPHDINDVALPITSIEEVGFVLSKVVILTYPYNNETKEYEENKQEFSTEKGDDLTSFESFEMLVQVGGLTVEYYYDRIMVDYSVKYVETIDPDHVIVTNPRNDITYSARYGATVTFTATDTYYNEDTGSGGDNETGVGGDGLIYIHQSGLDPENNKEAQRTASRKMTENKDDNILIFYYYKKTTQIKYEKVCTVADLASLNAITLAGESVTSASAVTGSKATAGKGFEFKGWFKDQACETPVNPTWVIDGTLLKPLELVDNFDGVEDDIITFYAKFEPKYGSLVVIKNQGDTSTPAEPTESFLFHIKGQDSNNQHIDMVITITNAGTKTIDKIPVGNYTVTEMGKWAYTFVSPSGAVGESVEKYALVEEGKSAPVVEFERYNQDSDWLTGERIDEKE